MTGLGESAAQSKDGKCSGPCSRDWSLGDVNWTFLRVLVVVFAVCMLANVMSASGMDATSSESGPAPIAASESLELALVSIILGGCLVFLFRPKRYQTAE